MQSEPLSSLLAIRKSRHAVIAQAHEKTRQSLALIDRCQATLARCDSHLALSRLRVERYVARLKRSGGGGAQAIIPGYATTRPLDSDVNVVPFQDSLSDLLLAQMQHMHDGIRETCLGKQAIILKIREQRARRRLSLNQRDETWMASARLFVRQKLQDGGLPKEGGPVFSGSPGRRGKCDACGCLLRAWQLVMEVPAGQPGRIFSLHADCFTLWLQERHPV